MSHVSRRAFVVKGVSLGAMWELRRAAWALGFSSSAPVCNVVAEQEVGPYYVADELLRSNIREGKPGLPLTLRLLVMDSRSCQPLQRAAIDVWHCDALGLYAGFTKMDPQGPGGPGGPGGPPPPGFNPEHPDPQHPDNRPGPPEGFGPPPMMKPTDQLTFLRGIQFTDLRGQAEFHTVFPGFYMGRTNHIHFKVREDGHIAGRPGSFGGDGKTYVEGHTSHTGQVFFPETFAEELMRHEPYARHKIHRTTQAEDGVFQHQHGEASVSKLRAVDVKRPEAGYIAELVVAVDPTKTPGPAQRGGPEGPGRPGGPPGAA